MTTLSACLSCTQNQPKLELALIQAGENRAELEKVLSRYSIDIADTLKYKAAVFLIENMPGYRYYEGSGISDYGNYFKALKTSTSEPGTILDSIAETYGRFRLGSQQERHDIETIDSTYLCNHIELAFGAWQAYPWSRQYDFEAFCEYILPYRIGNETLTNWRTAFFERYSSILDSVALSSPIAVARLLRDSVINRLGDPRFTMTRPADYPTIDALTSQHLAGACDDLTQFSISLFRTFGIAVAEDIIPLRGDANMGHSWVSLFDANGDLYNTDFFGDIQYVSETMVNRASLKAKVFRRHFSFNDDAYKMFAKHGVVVPGRLFNSVYRSTDVTEQYANTLLDLRLGPADLYVTASHPAMAFLVAPSWREWVPIAWGEFDGDGGITFEEVDGGHLLRVAYFDEKGIRFLSSPFFVHKQSRLPVFIPDADFNRVNEVTLYTKYGLYGRDRIFLDRMVGGHFEGADNPAFASADTLHVITKRPYRLFTEAAVDSTKTYRYLRYRGKEGSHSNVAEIEFWSGHSKLEGKAIGTAGAMNNDPRYEYAAAFDGRTETSFDHATSGDGWTGIELVQPAPITKIRYAPRNYDNFIKDGNDYELFVSTTAGWKSLERRKSTADSLLFQNVPEGALLYLRNHTGGQEERVFHIIDNRQVFR